jgi:hypothetical protein
MTPLPKARGIPPLTQIKIPRTAEHQVVVVVSEPDFITIVALCTIGLLITINVILRFPDFGILIESYNQF